MILKFLNVLISLRQIFLKRKLPKLYEVYKSRDMETQTLKPLCSLDFRKTDYFLKGFTSPIYYLITNMT